MRIFRLSVVAAFILMIGAAGIANGALAQQDQRFFGRWEPGSRSAGGWPLIVEPGRIYSLTDKNEIVDEQNYQVIRDFGDHVVIKNWRLRAVTEFDRLDPVLEIISVERRPPDRHFYVEYCASPEVNSFFFSTDDPDEIWSRILAWSKKEGEFPEVLMRSPNQCTFDPAKKTFRPSGRGGGMLFLQKLKKE